VGQLLLEAGHVGMAHLIEEPAIALDLVLIEQR